MIESILILCLVFASAVLGFLIGRVPRATVQLEFEYPPSAAVVTRSDYPDRAPITVVLIARGDGYNSIATHKLLKRKYNIPPEAYLHSSLVGTEPDPCKASKPTET